LNLFTLFVDYSISEKIHSYKFAKITGGVNKFGGCMISLTSVSPTWYVDESTMYIGYFWWQKIGHTNQGVVCLCDNNIIK
jgi:hypothetical protein